MLTLPFKAFLEPPFKSVASLGIFNLRLAAQHAQFSYFTWTLHLTRPQERQRFSNKKPGSRTALFSLDDNLLL